MSDTRLVGNLIEEVSQLRERVRELEDLLRWRDAEKEPPESLQKCLLLDPDAGAVEVAYWHGDFFSYRGLFNWTHWRPIGPLPG